MAHEKPSNQQRPSGKPKAKKSTRGRAGSGKQSSKKGLKSLPGGSLGTAILDRMMEDIKELVEARRFATAAEGEAFISGLFAARNIPWLTQPDGIGALPGVAVLEALGVVPYARGDVARPSLDEAQDLIYDAWQAPTKRECVRLARQALAISPDCADAYVILAEQTARTPLAAKKLYEQGVAAAERTLGPRTFVEDAGHFWGLLETRPYMRARFGLASTLRKLGDHSGAIEHLKDLLRLNPEDNQGVRYILLNWLLAEPDRGSDVGDLLDQFRDDASTDWAFGRSLYLFRSEGATKRASGALRSAIAENPHVSGYLLGRTKIPAVLPDTSGWGDDSEAMIYAAGALPAWHSEPGAIEWVREVVEGSGPRLVTR